MYRDVINRGYAYLRRGDPTTAKQQFQQAIELEPGYPQGYFGLAQVHIEQNQSEEAQAMLRQALETDPRYVAARAFLGIERLKCYDLDSAQEELDRALKDEPNDLLVHIKYSEYFYRLGFYDRAVALLETGLSKPHGANEYVVSLARRRLQQAREKARTIILRQPPDPRLLFQSIRRLFSRKKSAQSQTAGTVELS
jgi:Tfp pilus assembly protein PilF